MKRYYTLILIAILFTSCASKKMLVGSNVVHDGSSFEKAIIITATNDRAGVDAEYVYLSNTYPGCKTNSQSLNYHDNKPYDVLHIVTADGKQMAIYFDISKSFGKF